MNYNEILNPDKAIEDLIKSGKASHEAINKILRNKDYAMKLNKFVYDEETKKRDADILRIVDEAENSLSKNNDAGYKKLYEDVKLALHHIYDDKKPGIAEYISAENLDDSEHGRSKTLANYEHDDLQRRMNDAFNTKILWKALGRKGYGPGDVDKAKANVRKAEIQEKFDKHEIPAKLYRGVPQDKLEQVLKEGFYVTSGNNFSLVPIFLTDNPALAAGYARGSSQDDGRFTWNTIGIGMKKPSNWGDKIVEIDTSYLDTSLLVPDDTAFGYELGYGDQYAYPKHIPPQACREYHFLSDDRYKIKK